MLSQAPAGRSIVADAGADPESILDALPDAVIGIGREGRVTYANPSAGRLWRLAREAMVGLPAAWLVDDRSGEKLESLIPGSSSGDDSRKLSAIARRSDGTHFSAEVVAAETAGRSMVVATVREITPQLRPARRDHGDGIRRAEFERAVAERELFPRYQPVVDLVSGRVYGFEALMRWRHPERGELAAGAFIEDAEEAGMLEAMGDVVIKAALRDLRAWLESGLEVDVGVNLAPSQIATPGFPARMLDELDAAGVEPGQLLIEVTEAGVEQRPRVAAENLRSLEAFGVMVAIDDFGTGYSSLSRLRELRVDRLKLDRGFVRDLAEDPAAVAVARAILDLARGLGLRVAAEGVETEAQRHALINLGYERAQGYLFCRPVVAEEVPDVVRLGTPYTELS